MVGAGEPNQLELPSTVDRQPVETSENPMRHLNYLSFLMLGIGTVVTAAGIMLDAGAVVTLVGMMLVVAGVIKIITVRIWNGFFDSDSIVGK
jgi:hypothetical protein